MTATKKFNRVRASILVVVIVALNLATATNLYATEPDKKMYDHSRLKNLDAEDAEYIMSQVEGWNAQHSPFVVNIRMLFFDNLREIDKETAAVISTSGQLGGVFLGVPSIDDDTLEPLLSAWLSGENHYPYLRTIVFSRLKTMSDSQVRILLKWRGLKLVVPNTLEISTEAETLINDNYRRWDFVKLPESELAAYRQQLIKENIINEFGLE